VWSRWNFKCPHHHPGHGTAPPAGTENLAKNNTSQALKCNNKRAKEKPEFK